MKQVLNSYEELNLTHYTNMDGDKLVFLNPANKDLKDGMQHTAENLRNPFTDIYHWVKGELYDLKAMAGAIAVRNTVEKNGQALLKKKQSTAKNLEDVNAGKKTLGTIFKSDKDAGSMANMVETVEREIEVNQTLLDLLTIYLGETELPKFKREKLALYDRVLQQFHVIEINNSHQLASFWSTVLQSPTIKNMQV